ncbi:MAG: hypothetical protein JRM72_07120 [Nitrososphaerota archaeon]|jgi:hypothetical protein|nr:hypothetical protein [Nitrososphaerota archaeon]
MNEEPKIPAQSDELDTFLGEVLEILGLENKRWMSIDEKGRLLSKLNAFLYQTYEGIGTTTELDNEEFNYFSDFHKYWKAHHQEILGIEVAPPSKCRDVALVLDKIHREQGDSIYELPSKTDNLSIEQIAEVRFFTANQDFRASISKDIYETIIAKYPDFGKESVAKSPEDFLKEIGVTNLSQTDKRSQFAKNAADFLIKNNISAFGLAKRNGYDASRIRTELESNQGMGYKRKKADMFIRDMFVLRVWPNLTNIENIDVASDRNTMRVALRLGIITSKIPLISSFLDIFSYQYELMDTKSAEAWRTVWKEWGIISPEAHPRSPALMDYMLYRMGQTCFNSAVVEYHCNVNATHIFYKDSKRTKRCSLCGGKATPKESKLIALADVGEAEMPGCPLKKKCHGVCQWHNLVKKDIGRVKLEPPKSISVLGRTGWESARTTKEQGAGGPMG